jgi:hypothetical protein
MLSLVSLLFFFFFFFFFLSLASASPNLFLETPFPLSHTLLVMLVLTSNFWLQHLATVQAHLGDL